MMGFNHYILLVVLAGAGLWVHGSAIHQAEGLSRAAEQHPASSEANKQRDDAAADTLTEDEIEDEPRGPVAVASDDVRTSRNTVTFNASSSHSPTGEELRYYWDFGDGNHDEGEIVTHRYRYGGEFEAVLTVDDQQGLRSSQDHDTVNVFINRPPEVFFEIPYVTCRGDTIPFDGSMTYDPDGGDLLYEWDFDDGSIARAKEGRHVFEDQGQYEVTLTVDDNEGLDNSVSSFTHEITVVGAPLADAGTDMQMCAGESIQFNGSGSEAAHSYINEFNWDFGDGNTGGGEQPMHTYDAPGIYEVHLEVVGTDYGNCPNTDTDRITVEAVPPANADFSLPEAAGKDHEIALDPNPSITGEGEVTAFTWTLDTLETIEWQLQRGWDGEEVSTEWVKYSNKSAGDVSEPNRQDEGVLPVTYRELPPGEYRISLQVQNDSPSPCHTDRAEAWITVEEEPQFSMEEADMLVPGEEHWFQVRQTSGRALEQLEWDFDDGNTATGPEVAYAFDEPGVYEVTLYDNRERRELQQQQVVVNAPPEPEIDGPNRLEPGDTGEWSALNSEVVDGTIEEYEWFFSDGYRQTGAEVQREFEQPGNYSLTLTVTDDAGMSNSVQSRSTTVTVGERPELRSELPDILCPDIEIDLTEGLALEARDSTAVDIVVGEQQVPYHEARTFSLSYPGNYNIRAVESGGSVNNPQEVMAHHRMVINGPPEIHAEIPSGLSVDGVPGRFDASNSFDPDGGELRVHWDLGDGTTRTGEVIEHQYESAGTYSVNLTVMDDRNMSCSIQQEEFTIEVTP